jgi:hypothetical protein
VINITVVVVCQTWSENLIVIRVIYMKHEHHGLHLISYVHSNGCCSVFQHAHNVENISLPPNCWTEFEKCRGCHYTVTVVVAVKWNCLDTATLFWMLRLLLVATESVFTASTMRTRGLAMKIISSLEQSKS